MVDTARKHEAGLFVLALTSNKEGPEVQHARTEDGTLVAGRVLDHLRALNVGEEPLGSFGAVIGATIGALPDLGAELDFDLNGPILAPGFGAQGGTVADIRRIFGSAVAAVTPSSSRELLRRGPSAEAMRDEALRLNDELRALAG
jgi:orotidine-5'-phosphate decarboxylase